MFRLSWKMKTLVQRAGEREGEKKLTSFLTPAARVDVAVVKDQGRLLPTMQPLH